MLLAEDRHLAAAVRSAGTQLSTRRRRHWRLVVRLLNLLARSTSNVSLTVAAGLTDQCLTAIFTLSAAVLFLLDSSIT